MSNAVDFDAIRKKRQRNHRLKQLLILAGVAALAALGIALSELLVQSDISTKLSDFTASFGGTGYPIGLPGGLIRDVGDLGGNLMILNDTSLYIYNKKGKLIGNVQQMTGRTVLEAERSRALIYDVGGRRLEIHSPTKTLYTHNLDDMLISADLGESGGFVTVTTPKQFVAQVSAYDPNFEWLFTWYSSEHMVSGASLSPKGTMMAVACVDANGGVLESVLYLFRFSVKEEIAQIRVADELVMSLDFPEEGRFTAITERGMYVYSAEGRQTGHYSLPATPLTAFERGGGDTLLLCGERGEGTQRLVLLDAQAKERAALPIDRKVLDLAMDGSSIYLLTDAGITKYNRRLEPLRSWEVSGVSRLTLVGGRLYYLTVAEIHQLEE